MELTEQGLMDFLLEKANERWDDGEQPYLLSLVGTDLKARDQDYKTVLGEEKLKLFVRRSGEAGGYRLVEHPTQKAKVGIVPAGKEFEFGEDDVSADGQRSAPRERIGISERERVVLNFLRALGHLPETLLDDVVIPVKVLARLLARK